jgi:hypothetical protein
MTPGSRNSAHPRAMSTKTTTSSCAYSAYQGPKCSGSHPNNEADIIQKLGGSLRRGTYDQHSIGSIGYAQQRSLCKSGSSRRTCRHLAWERIQPHSKTGQRRECPALSRTQSNAGNLEIRSHCHIDSQSRRCSGRHRTVRINLPSEDQRCGHKRRAAHRARDMGQHSSDQQSGGNRERCTHGNDTARERGVGRRHSDLCEPGRKRLSGLFRSSQ